MPFRTKPIRTRVMKFTATKFQPNRNVVINELFLSEETAAVGSKRTWRTANRGKLRTPGSLTAALSEASSHTRIIMEIKEVGGFAFAAGTFPFTCLRMLAYWLDPARFVLRWHFSKRINEADHAYAGEQNFAAIINSGDFVVSRPEQSSPTTLARIPFDSWNSRKSTLTSTLFW